MRDLQSIPLITPAHHKTPVETEAHTPHRAHHAAERAPAYPVGRVPQADERVAAADREVARRGREGEREASGGVGVQGVEGGEGGVGGEFYGAVAVGEEDGGGRRGVWESGLVCLEGLGEGRGGFEFGDRYRDQCIVLL